MSAGSNTVPKAIPYVDDTSVSDDHDESKRWGGEDMGGGGREGDRQG